VSHTLKAGASCLTTAAPPFKGGVAHPPVRRLLEAGCGLREAAPGVLGRD